MAASEALRIAAVVALYWVISISMVFLNKHLLSGSISLDAPLFITWYQSVVGTLTCLAMGYASRWSALLAEFRGMAAVDASVARRILPLSAIFVGMIATNNLCLKLVGVAFYTVGRSLTTVFNVALTYVLLRTATSTKVLLTCALIISGFLLGVREEGGTGELSPLGVVFGVAASLFVALNAIYVKKALPHVEGDTWQLTMYNNANASLLFVPLVFLAGEHATVVRYEHLRTVDFWLMMTLSGFFGVAIAVATVLQIKYTSPLTHNVSGTAKACAQTLLAVWLHREQKTALWWLSNAMVIGGSMAYAQVRHTEMQQEKRSARPEAAEAKAPDASKEST